MKTSKCSVIIVEFLHDKFKNKQLFRFSYSPGFLVNKTTACVSVTYFTKKYINQKHLTEGT